MHVCSFQDCLIVEFFNKIFLGCLSLKEDLLFQSFCLEVRTRSGYKVPLWTLDMDFD